MPRQLAIVDREDVNRVRRPLRDREEMRIAVEANRGAAARAGAERPRQTRLGDDSSVVDAKAGDRVAVLVECVQNMVRGREAHRPAAVGGECPEAPQRVAGYREGGDTVAGR